MAIDSVRSLTKGRWCLNRARQVASAVAGDRAAVKTLVAAMFGDGPELRKRAADVARRITDSDAAPLMRYADELAGYWRSLRPRSRGRSGTWGWWSRAWRIRESRDCERRG